MDTMYSNLPILGKLNDAGIMTSMGESSIFSVSSWLGFMPSINCLQESTKIGKTTNVIPMYMEL